MEQITRIVAIFLMLMIVVNVEAVETQQAVAVKKVANSSDLNESLKKDLAAIVVSLEESIVNARDLKSQTSDQMIIQAIDICCQVQQESINSVQRAVDRVGHYDPAKTDEYIEDLKIWVGGVFSDQTECLEGFEQTPGQFADKIKIFLEKPRNLTMTAFEVIKQISEQGRN